jgi:hypothetical protein
MEITWSVAQLDRNTSDGFVNTVHWRVNAVDGDKIASSYGTVGYTQEEGKTLVPYSNLTETAVLAWVQESLNKETVEASLAKQIELLKNPVVSSGTPWQTLES